MPPLLVAALLVAAVHAAAVGAGVARRLDARVVEGVVSSQGGLVVRVSSKGW